MAQVETRLTTLGLQGKVADIQVSSSSVLYIANSLINQYVEEKVRKNCLFQLIGPGRVFMSWKLLRIRVIRQDN